MKCRDCERLKIEKVNKNFSRGHGRCSTYMDWPEGNARFWMNDNRYKCFSDQACKYYIPRTSTLEVGQGGEDRCVKVHHKEVENV